MPVSIIQLLSENEKELLFISSKILEDHLDEFSNIFFDKLLLTNARDLFFATNMDILKNKFISSLRIILINMKYPTNLNDYINLLITKHIHHNINTIQLESFADSFIDSLKLLDGKNFEGRTLKAWKRFIDELLNLFRKQLT